MTADNCASPNRSALGNKRDAQSPPGEDGCTEGHSERQCGLNVLHAVQQQSRQRSLAGRNRFELFRSLYSRSRVLRTSNKGYHEQSPWLNPWISTPQLSNSSLNPCRRITPHVASYSVVITKQEHISWHINSHYPPDRRCRNAARKNAASSSICSITSNRKTAS